MSSSPSNPPTSPAPTQNLSLFGTDGIRGRANEYPITPEITLRLGKAIGRVLKAKNGLRNRVVLGKDTRVSGYMLETALTSGLVSQGMDVFLVGPLPTPAVAHLTYSMASAAGIMLTASHNPYEDNGLKIFGPDGYKLNDELEAVIEKYVLHGLDDDEPASCRQLGKAYRIDDARGRYIEFSKQTVHNVSLHGLKIVLDCAHGAAYFLAPLIFQELGAEVIETGVSPDGYNINANCGAMYPQQAAALVREHGADIGISFDGDADRVIFTDHTGTVVSGDRILTLVAIALKEQGKLAKNTMVTTIMSNLGMHEALASHGISVQSVGVGDRQVIEALRSQKLNFGGENSGHLIFADHATTGDGILSALQVLRLMKKKDATLAELSQCMSEYPNKLTNLNVRTKKPLAELPEIQILIAEFDKQFGSEGRHLIRYSGTENKIRILIEHRDAEVVDQWSQRFADAATSALGKAS